MSQTSSWTLNVAVALGFDQEHSETKTSQAGVEVDVKRTMSRKAAVTVIGEVGVPNVKLDVKRSGDSHSEVDV